MGFFKKLGRSIEKFVKSPERVITAVGTAGFSELNRAIADVAGLPKDPLSTAIPALAVLSSAGFTGGQGPGGGVIVQPVTGAGEPSVFSPFITLPAPSPSVSQGTQPLAFRQYTPAGAGGGNPAWRSSGSSVVLSQQGLGYSAGREGRWEWRGASVHRL